MQTPIINFACTYLIQVVHFYTCEVIFGSILSLYICHIIIIIDAISTGPCKQINIPKGINLVVDLRLAGFSIFSYSYN